MRSPTTPACVLATQAVRHARPVRSWLDGQLADGRGSPIPREQRRPLVPVEKTKAWFDALYTCRLVTAPDAPRRLVLVAPPRSRHPMAVRTIAGAAFPVIQ